jgi:putative transposase
MKKNKAFKFRLYPTSEQKVLLGKTFGCCRLVFNYFLNLSNEKYEKEKTSLRYKDYALMLNDLKKEKEFLKEVDSISLQQELRHLDDSFKHFFKYKKGYPNYKRKSMHNDSYSTINVNNNIVIIDKKHIKLPKLGIFKCKIHRDINAEYKLKSATISRNPSGKYYVSVLYEFEEKAIEYKIDESKIIGLDYQMKNLFISDDRIKTNDEFLKMYRKNEKRLQFLQKTLSRRQKPNYKKDIKSSNRYEKQRIKVAKLLEYQKNKRNDYYNKLSKEIANQYDIVVIEDLNMQDMARANKLNSKATYDNGFGIFRNILKYKLEALGKKLIVVDKYFPSSKICNVCGHKNELLTITDKTWECPNCHTIHNRDINASINLKKEGLRIYNS